MPNAEGDTGMVLNLIFCEEARECAPRHVALCVSPLFAYALDLCYVSGVCSCCWWRIMACLPGEGVCTLHEDDWAVLIESVLSHTDTR